MSKETNISAKYEVAAEAISKAGGTPIPPNETLLKLLTYFINEDEVDFVSAFKDQRSQTLEQLKASSGLSEEEILAKVKSLSGKGVIFDQPNTAGVMVYRLLPLLNVGTFEYNFMGKIKNNQRNREISDLFTKLFQEFADIIDKNYDSLVPMLMQSPPVDRTVPLHENKTTGKPVTIVINKPIQGHVERIVPTQQVKDIIMKFDEIALGHCFCRHYKDIAGKPCKQTDERESCFTFGKSARYTAKQGFARMITREEALDVLRRSEEAGLVHKAYHPNFNSSKDETSICNCCKCCCANSVRNMFVPIVNETNYLTKISKDLCTGCGTCVEKCHTDACYIGDDGKADRIEERCIGCGVCAAFCPEEAISLIEGKRIVRILPKRAVLKGNDSMRNHHR